ncbi:MFS transporter [Paraburkholderia unamae]|uniref:MFS transporter n=1 Tax=Paraburkholderia unamae TaxID=219649 RepID=A0ACC6RPC1_9BURK
MSRNDNEASRRVAILAAVCLAGLALPLAFSGGAVATPAIGRAFARDAASAPAALTWVTNAFMLAFGSLLMAAGTLADQYGRKRVFAFGVTGFTLASLALACAPTLLSLDLLRAAQGLSAAAALAGGTAALAQEFDGHARTRAFSLLGTTFGLGLAFGPVIAGLLIERLGWRAVFATGAVAGAFALVFGVPRMRESRDPNARGLDWPGTLTFTAALSCFTYGVIEAPSRGWTQPLVAGLLAASVLLACAFVVIERRIARPMLDLSLFRYPRFVGVQLLPIATCFCYVVLLVVLPLRLIGVEGYREIDAGWLMLALSAPMLVVPLAAAVLTRWLSPGVVSGMGLAIAAAGLYALALRGGANASAIGPMLAIGTGAAMPWGLMDGLSVSVVPKERAGMATGIFSTTRVAGEGIALACVSALLAALTQTRLLAAVHVHADAGVLAQTSARLAAGDLAQAAAWLPGLPVSALRAAYADAFSVLLIGLAALTLGCAIAVLVFLGRTRAASAVQADLPEHTATIVHEGGEAHTRSRV